MGNVQPQTIADSLIRRVKNARYMKKISEIYKKSILKDIDKLLSVSPETAYALQASFYSILGENSNSVSASRNTIEIKESAVNYFNFGFCQEILNNTEDSIELYKKALARLEPNEIELSDLLLGRFIYYYDFNSVKKLETQLSPQIRNKRDDIPVFLKIYEDLFKKDDALMYSFGKQLKEVITQYIAPRFHVSTHYEFIEDRLYDINQFFCTDDEDLILLAQCNSAISDFMVHFEEAHQLNFSDFYIVCEAVEW